MGSNTYGESLIGTNLVPTTPRRSLAMTNHGNLPAIPEAYQPPNVDEVPPAGIPRHSVRDATTTGAPPSNFYTSSVANLIQPQIPHAPVDEGPVSRQASVGTTLPPYSPRGFLDNGDAPPLPER